MPAGEPQQAAPVPALSRSFDGWRRVLARGWLLVALMPPVVAWAQLPAPPALPVAEMSDAWITTKVRAELLPLLREGNAQLQVETVAGVVTLQGQADNRLTRERIVERVARVRGVRAVEAEGLLPEAPAETAEDAAPENLH